MKEEIRRAIAFTLLAPESGEADAFLYSHALDHRTKMRGNRRDFHDYGADARVVNYGTQLYHYGLWQYVDLAVNGASFSGYDHGSKNHFEGVINSGTVQLYDRSESRYFQYAIAPPP